jgi:ubiquinone/menaquinone biosynthesis C-methylase UbiE
VAVSEHWDAEAAGFDEEPDHGLRDPEIREAWRRTLREHLPEPPARVADLGCGTGTLSVLLADEGYAVDGVDFSPEMVDAAREKAAGRPDVRFAVGDAGDPPFERATYDVVLCRHVLWALPDKAAALGTWVGLLRAHGRLVLVEGFWHTGAGLRAAEAEALLRAAGREPTTFPLREDVYWGGPTGDERYLVVA